MATRQQPSRFPPVAGSQWRTTGSTPSPFYLAAKRTARRYATTAGSQSFVEHDEHAPSPTLSWKMSWRHFSECIVSRVEFDFIVYIPYRVDIELKTRYLMTFILLHTSDDHSVAVPRGLPSHPINMFFFFFIFSALILYANKEYQTDGHRSEISRSWTWTMPRPFECQRSFLLLFTPGTMSLRQSCVFELITNHLSKYRL